MSVDLFRLDGKVALITGASRGLGAAMAVALAKAGADIALHANEQPALATATEIAQTSGRETEVLTANLASLLSFQGGINVPGYAAAKGGVMQLTKALANEGALHGINVNAIAPGYMQTDNTTALRADQLRNRQITERIPAGRWGTPQDLAGAALFLASPASDYVHGHVLVVDGGWMGR